jgi:cell wall-associated NlpC family hydrolase
MTTPPPRPAFLLVAAVAMLASACAGQQPRVRVLPPVPPPAARTSGGAAIVRTAESLLGAPYREGGALPDGFDCSGLVNYVFARHGINVPRDVRRQATVGVHVARTDIRPGDLLFFATTGSAPTHVAIAMDGRRFIHAPKNGAAVRIESLASSYWAKRFLEARRIPPA